MDLYGLLRQFNAVGGIEKVGQSAFCFLMSLWQKSNELHWTREFTMTNTELIYRGGFKSEETLRRTRSKLQDLGFFEYKKPSNRKFCGTYILEFNLLKAFGYEKEDFSEASSLGSCEDSFGFSSEGSCEDINKSNITILSKQKEKDKKESDTFVSLIENYSENSLLKSSLEDFVEYRKSGKGKFTVQGLKLNLKTLSKLSESDAEKIAIVNQTIERGWTGFFPLKNVESKKGVNSDDWKFLDL
ncbi:hypothetical protein [Miniphocaeibacter massiliensis]|uniref:hypothetical protein n=1 Tax=Miniphocaeibacter massiliensis TaxID=2041841 RepID=UPI000C1BD924|nr:hypothetical protein [Miniphocaeibacter massiliensis]